MLDSEDVEDDIEPRPTRKLSNSKQPPVDKEFKVYEHVSKRKISTHSQPSQHSKHLDDKTSKYPEKRKKISPFKEPNDDTDSNSNLSSNLAGEEKSHSSHSSRPKRQKKLSKKYSNGDFIAEHFHFIGPEPSSTDYNVPIKITLKKGRKEDDPLSQEVKSDSTPKNDEMKHLKHKRRKEIKSLEIDPVNLNVKRSEKSGPLVIAEEATLPDLLIPMPHIQNHFRQMVFKTITSKHIFRLMCWNSLIYHFNNGSLFIWFNPKSSSGKLIATRAKSDRPSYDYVDVKHLQGNRMDLPEIVRGLINEKLPGKATNGNNTFGIFVFTGQIWEIRGTIIRKPNETDIIRDTTPTNVTQIVSTPNGKTQLHLESKSIPLTTAQPSTDELNIQGDRSISIPIPLGTKDSRWFMLILENDFSVLKHYNSAATIRYSQIQTACQYAMKVQRTVRFIVPREDLEPHPKGSTNPAFGGYAVPGLLERVFFGPYGLTEPHGLMTYRYLNGKLVDTKVVEQLYGGIAKKSKGNNKIFTLFVKE